MSDPIHIGKSSFGWRFNFQTQNERWNDPPVVWNSFPMVKDTLKRLTVDSSDYVIMNEYDEIVGYDDFIELVESKQEECNPDDFTYARNVDGYRFTDDWFC